MGIETQAVTYLACDRILRTQQRLEDYMSNPRPHHVFAYVAEGKITCRDHRGTVFGEAGEIVFIPYRCCYRLTWHNEPKTVVYSCYFNFPAFSEPFETHAFPLQKLQGFSDALADFEHLHKVLSCENSAFEALGCFYRLLHRLSPALVGDAIREMDERIRCAIAYLNANRNTRLTVEELASSCHMSLSRFYHLFKKETGMSPISYKNMLTVRNAEQLLANKKLSIEEISESVGFSSSAYFRRVFREITGKSPREYRRDGIGL